jgi:formate dehydrogenase subunit gamma
MAGTGVVMYLPALSARIGDRPTLKAIHLTAAVLWVTALVVVALVGDRRALREAVRQLETFDADDRHWLRGPAMRRGRPKGWRSRVPQGRFNAAEKSHAIVQAALAVLFVVSGVLLWLGERDTAFRLPGTIPLHDAATYVALALVAGHLYLALLHPPTRPALSGIVRGDVDAAWAREHHRKWDAPPVPAPGGGGGSSPGRAGQGPAPAGAGSNPGGAGPEAAARLGGPGLAPGRGRPGGAGPVRVALATAVTAAGVLVVVLVVL